MQKMNEQNHKISSMVGLVSTMAEEVGFMRSRMQILSAGISHGGNVDINNNFISHSSDSLIHVSDDEEESTSDDGDSSDDDNTSTDDSSDDDDDDDDSVNTEDESVIDTQNIRTINMGESIINNNLFENNVDELNNEFDDELNEDVDNSNDDHDDDLNDDELNAVDVDFNDDDDHYEEHTHAIELNNINNEELDNTTTQQLHLNENKTFTLTNTDFIKSIDISNLDESQKDTETQDYKKMSLNKLRAVVMEKELSIDSSKLKKNELLKLLGYD